MARPVQIAQFLQFAWLNRASMQLAGSEIGGLSHTTNTATPAANIPRVAIATTGWRREQKAGTPSNY
jgi:hypothetical protein